MHHDASNGDHKEWREMPLVQRKVAHGVQQASRVENERPVLALVTRCQPAMTQGGHRLHKRKIKAV